jgi:AcrR family transcriptional regulator
MEVAGTRVGIQERKEREFKRREREILEAALHLFSTEDWQSVTVEQIAERAEIGKGTVYKHFASKDEIYARLALEFQRRSLEKLERIDASLTVMQRLRLLIRGFWEQHQREREYHRLVQYCEREDFRKSLPAAVRDELAELDARFEQHVHAVLQEGIDQGLLPRKAIPALVFGPMAALQGAARLIWGGCLEREAVPGEYVEEITNFILAGMMYQEWLAEEGLDSEQAARRAQAELRAAEAELAAEAPRGA